MKNPFKKSLDNISFPISDEKKIPMPVDRELQINIDYLKLRLGDSADLIFRNIDVAGEKAVLLFCDGLCNGILINDGIIKPISLIGELPFDDDKLIDYICEKTYAGIDQVKTKNIDEVFVKLFSGFAVLLVDNASEAVCFGVQGFEKRSVEQASNEVQERGALEGFVENSTDNIAMLRRKLKTPSLKIEKTEIGKTSNTRVCVCYLSDRVDKRIVEDVKKKLSKIKLDTVLGPGYIQPFLDTSNLSFFTAVGSTERPDTFASKLAEGRVGVIIDGSPFALYVPLLFVENFQTLDDYNCRPYFALFLRILRIACFLISVLVPGIYVAICTFHQEVLSQALLVEVAIQESATPFSIMIEALLIHFIYEIVREAGIRMPKAVGHAVSIVGGLVIGDAAVTAGIIAAPMLIIVAITAICSFVVSPIYEAVSILKFLIIIVGGVSGFFGIMIVFGTVVISICAMNPYSIPHSSPISPFEIGAMRDTILRLGWKRLGDRELKINTLEK